MARRKVDDDRLHALDGLRFLGTPEGIRWVAAFWAASVFVNALNQLAIPLTGLIAFLLNIALWLMLYRVASEVLLAAADTAGKFPDHSFEGADGLALKHIGLWFLATLALAGATVWFGRAGTLLGAAILILVLPAATILLTIGRRLLMALWPPLWLRLATRIGSRDYGLLCGVLVAIGVVYVLAVLVANALNPGGWLAPIAAFTVWSAGVLAWFHLAGRAVALHGHELNIADPEAEAYVAPPPERFTRDADTLWEEIRTRGGSPAMHAELVRQLEASGDRERILAHGRIHVEALVMAFDAPEEAVDRAAELLELDPGFHLANPASGCALVEAAADLGRRELTMRLAENVLATAPKPRIGIRVRLRACELMADARPAHRALAEQWFRELMVSDIPETLRPRMQVLVGAYLGPGDPGG